MNLQYEEQVWVTQSLVYSLENWKSHIMQSIAEISQVSIIMKWTLWQNNSRCVESNRNSRRGE